MKVPSRKVQGSNNRKGLVRLHGV